ncbi:hypothetical protein GCM10029992_21820 [Glycomyces albus]
MLASAAAYLLIAYSIPDVQAGLAVAGLALGLVIAPLSSVALSTTPKVSTAWPRRPSSSPA